MSLEGPDKQENRNRSDILKTAALAAVLLGAVDQGPAQALEISPKTPWATAIQHNIRDAVMKEKKESMTGFIRFSDGTSIWPAVGEGTDKNIHYSYGLEINHLLSNDMRKSIDVHCGIHTHPYSSTKLLGQNDESYQIKYAPPSYIDINGEGNLLPENYDIGLRRDFTLAGMPVGNSFSAEADSQGVWYFDTGDPKKRTEDNKKNWEYAYGAFANRSYSNPDFNFQVEYRQLQQAYKIYLGANIRFVPYEDIPNEPPCAGVHYGENVEGTTSAPPPKTSAGTLEGTRPPLPSEPVTRPHLPGSDEERPPIFNVGSPRR